LIAKLVHADHISWVSTQTNIYELDQPYQGHDHVAVSHHAVEFGQWRNAGTEIIGCLANGAIDGDSVVALYQTFEVLDFADALARIGYTLAADPETAAPLHD
jgi:hypothetical protein